MENLSINKNRELLTAENYELLKEQGLDLIQKISGQVWTDFNSHDPGITMLELLSYAITDLGYRTGADITSIMADENNLLATDSYHSAREILQSHVVTVNDLRKVLLDTIPEIRNVHVILSPNVDKSFASKYDTSELIYSTVNRQLKGLFRVIVETHRDVDQNSTLRARIYQKLHENRNLCEDVRLVAFAKPINVAVKADVVVEKETDVEPILAEIYFRIENLINPQVKFYSLDEMREKGKLTEEILDGPVLNNGFIDSEEFKILDPKTHLHASDIINEIMDIEGVLEVNLNTMKLKRSVPEATNTSLIQREWNLEYKEGFSQLNNNGTALYSPDYFPVMDLTQMNIRFMKGNQVSSPDARTIQMAQKKFKLRLASNVLKSSYSEFQLPEASYQDFKSYSAIQDELPIIYGTSQVGLPANAPEKRKVQALQLKGYLVFFEQLLANYLGQLANVKDLLSWKNGTTSTYFTQDIQATIKDSNLIFDGLSSNLNGLIEDGKTKLDRKNRLLEHLLARFNENMTEYAIMMFSVHSFQVANNNLIAHRRRVLDEYPVLSAERGKGFNYRAPAIVWDTDNVPGYQKRVARLLGIDNYNRRNLISLNSGVYSSEEGIHVIEHILLRPRQVTVTTGQIAVDPTFLNVQIGPTQNETCEFAEDPYSYQITVILPATAGRNKRFEYRKYAEKLLRMEAPAHIAIDVVWASNAELYAFETCYRAWLEGMAELPITQTTIPLEVATDFNCMMQALNNFQDVYESYYEVAAPRNEDTYVTNGEVLAELINPPGVNIIEAEILNQVTVTASASGTPTGFFPTNYLNFNTSNGRITVTNANLINGSTDANRYQGQGAGKWILDIRTKNNLDEEQFHRIAIEILNDRECDYIVDQAQRATDKQNLDTYLRGDVLAHLSNENVNVVAVEVSNLVPLSSNSRIGSIGIVSRADAIDVNETLIPGEVLDLFSGASVDTTGLSVADVGTILVLDPSKLKNFTSQTIGGQPYSVLNFKVQTTGEDGGITRHQLTFNFLKDQEAEFYDITPAKSMYLYAQNEIIARLKDGNGKIDSRTLVSGAIPAGTILEQNGQIWQLRINNLTQFRNELKTKLQTPESTARGGCAYQGPAALPSYTYNAAYDTVDETGGISTNRPLALTINRDTPAIYYINTTGTPGMRQGINGSMDSKINNIEIYADEYQDGDVLAQVFDGNGAIVSAVACNLSSMPGVNLNDQTGEITVGPPQNTAVVLPPSGESAFGGAAGVQIGG